ncbi:hypothetical protein GCM10027176_48900 [Actinoallomurus bryophytorum]
MLPLAASQVSTIPDAAPENAGISRTRLSHQSPCVRFFGFYAAAEHHHARGRPALDLFIPIIIFWIGISNTPAYGSSSGPGSCHRNAVRDRMPPGGTLFGGRTTGRDQHSSSDAAACPFTPNGHTPAWRRS